MTNLPADAGDPPAIDPTGTEAAAGAETAGGTTPAVDPEEPDEPDTIAVLARDMHDPVIGYPRQRVTLLLIAVLVIVSLFVAIGVLVREGMPA
ncbi:MAG TPA: hypothetical protein VFY23_03455 [Candidatus Limnocylindrales bacterium]|nr:hypothetical protein [Candidatus Limnocylindrales bacterium]